MSGTRDPRQQADQALRDAIAALPAPDGPGAELEQRLRARARAGLRRPRPPLWLSLAASVFVVFFAASLWRGVGPLPSAADRAAVPDAPAAMAEDSARQAHPSAQVLQPDGVAPVAERSAQVLPEPEPAPAPTATLPAAPPPPPAPSRPVPGGDAAAEAAALADREIAERPALAAESAQRARGEVATAMHEEAAAAGPADADWSDAGSVGRAQRADELLAPARDARSPALSSVPAPALQGFGEQGFREQAVSERRQRQAAAESGQQASALQSAAPAEIAAPPAPAAAARSAESAEVRKAAAAPAPRCEEADAEQCFERVRQLLAADRRAEAVSLLQDTLRRHPLPVPADLAELLQ